MFAIDSNGNLTQKTEGSDTWTYTWNAENQLTKVEKNSIEQARFGYDPLGRRVEKVAAGVTTTFTHDVDTILREVRGGAAFTYVHGPRIDEPLAVDSGSGLTYFHADVLGSVVKLTAAAGNVILSRQYDAWGRLEIGATESGYAFTGREWDAETGLNYYRARYYDPRDGRFISADPIGLLGGVNLYAYVGDDPVNATDPLGLAPQKCCPLKGNGKPNPDAAAGVCCKDGVYVVCFNADWYRNATARQRRCTTRHEESHIDDLKWIGLPCDKKDPCEQMGMPEDTANDSECRAYLKGYACLSGSKNYDDVLAAIDSLLLMKKFCGLVTQRRMGSR